MFLRPRFALCARLLLLPWALGGLVVSAQTARDLPLSDVEAHRRYQDTKLGEGRQADLALEYSRLLEGNPDSAYAHLHYGRALDPSSDYEKAVEHLQRAARLDPEMFWARFSLGTLYLSAGRYAVAERELLEAARLDANHAGAQYNLAFLYMLTGEREKSLERARRATALDPGFAPARELLERLEGRRGGLRNGHAWTLVVGLIILAVIANFLVLRKRYRKYLKETDAFEYARRSVRRHERHRPGARRPVPDAPPSSPKPRRP